LLGNSTEACDMNGVCSIQFVFESNGDVYPCDFYCIDNYFFGKINEDAFKSLDARREEISFINNPPKLHEDCKNCEYLYLCRGGWPRYKASNNKFRCYESYKYLFYMRLNQFKEIANLIIQNDS